MDEDYADLANLFGPFLEEELCTLNQYTQCASVALSFGECGHYEVIWPN